MVHLHRIVTLLCPIWLYHAYHALTASLPLCPLITTLPTVPFLELCCVHPVLLIFPLWSHWALRIHQALMNPPRTVLITTLLWLGSDLTTSFRTLWWTTNINIGSWPYYFFNNPPTATLPCPYCALITPLLCPYYDCSALTLALPGFHCVILHTPNPPRQFLHFHRVHRS